ncbi:MAG: rhodanese-like domain-containing protein [Ktedonobacteraceae bacterium]
MLQRLFGKSNVPSVTAPEAWTCLSEKGSNAVLVDVREPGEYKGGHARGAKNIPLSQIQKRVNEVPHDRKVLLICQSGHRSMQAANFLQQQGLDKVVNVHGGTSIWRLHNLPME